jgi:geranylgeranyl reductase family protein
MTSCDVLVVGGGPAGSTCAWRLVQAGFDVLVVDAASFPRHKACAGWITPPVFDALETTAQEYGASRSLEAITGFRTSVVGGPPVETRYGRTVSYAIRRTEFDTYLLRRSGARLQLGYRVDRVRRTADGWVVNDELQAPVVVGAGGHFCPVARALNAPPPGDTVVAAKVVEFQMDAAQAAACAVDSTTPEIYLDRDLTGYGWIVRKGSVLNVGFGRLGSLGLASHVAEFAEHVQHLGRLPAGTPLDWPGHAYLLRETAARNLVGDRVLLVGDAAGLAFGRSGEGIRPAIESGLAAADTLIAAHGSYGSASLAPYRARLDSRLGPVSARSAVHRARSSRMRSRIATPLLSTAWFTRRFLLDRWLCP